MALCYFSLETTLKIGHINGENRTQVVQNEVKNYFLVVVFTTLVHLSTNRTVKGNVTLKTYSK